MHIVSLETEKEYLRISHQRHIDYNRYFHSMRHHTAHVVIKIDF